MYTRWDLPWTVRRVLPPAVDVVEVVGIRVITPFARVHELTAVGPLVGSLERSLCRSPLRWFGGFLVIVLQRRA